MEGLTLLSPLNGESLQRVSDYLLDDGEQLWPYVDGIVYLRPKETLRASAVAAIQAGDLREARLLLLADQDDFSPTAPPSRAALNELLDASDALTLRDAMQLLNYGPVSEYFAYRWCSPTFSSGLRLLELGVQSGQPVVEYACGIGHFLRELQLLGIANVGIDIVYSKLWLARRFLEVAGPLICGDIERSGVVALPGPATVFCHDAFYFFGHKQAALTNMRRVAGREGRVAVGHVHTDHDAHGAGHSLPVSDYRELTEAEIWEDAALADSFRQQSNATLVRARESAAAVAWLEGQWAGPQVLRFDRFHPALRLNPLIGPQAVRWPSDGWKAEFVRDTQPLQAAVEEQLRQAEVRSLVGTLDAGTEVTSALTPGEGRLLVSQGILLNLPRRW